MKPGSPSTLHKGLRLALYGVGGLVLLLVAAAATTYAVTEYRLRRSHDVTVSTVAVTATDELIARGRHIANTRACADCHAEDFGGRAVIQDPMVGNLHGPNLTHGQGGLPSDYSDVDYVRAIRHGLSREGRALVLMPSIEYTVLSDEDLGALIAYLKSLPKVDRERGPVHLGPVARVLVLANQIKLSAEVIDHATPRPARVDATVTAEYGRYLAAGCIGCHGDNLAGGRVPGAPPDWPAAANLTSDPASGLGQWTEADFFRALRERRRPDGRELSPVMPAAFAQMTDEETRALWLYVKSLPAVSNSRRTH